MTESIVKNPSWWRRRSGLERSLFLVTAIVMAVGLCLGIALIIFLLKVHPSDAGLKISNKTDELCLTRGCIKTAAIILDNMNPEIDPCDDFYEFACGGYIKSKDIPEHDSEISPLDELTEKVQKQVKILLEEPAHPDDLRSFVEAKKLYKACMNKDLIEKRGLKPLHTLLSKIGGWPVIEGKNWTEENYDWKESIYALRKLGYNAKYLIDFSMDYDYKNSSRRMLYLSQAKIGLFRQLLVSGIDNDQVKHYFNYMVNVAVLLGADKESAEKELTEALEFEIKIANITLSQADRRNSEELYNLMTVTEVQEKYPYIPWLTYINNLLPPAIKLKETQEIVVFGHGYLENLGTILEETPNRTIANYLAGRLTRELVSHFSDDIRNIQYEFVKKFTDQTEKKPRWKECVNTARGLAIPLSAMYVRRHFSPEARRQALEMVADVKAEFRSLLKNYVDWMDAKTKENALEKLDTMATYIGYPDELMDGKKIEELYGSVNIDEKLYHESSMNLTGFLTDFGFNLIFKPVNKSIWYSHASTTIVNAEYAFTENSIEIPAAILQDIFFSSDRPKYMNYGGIGFTIAHEITHGFDDKGRQFDKEGVLVDWWDPTTKEAFLKKAQCIIDQYSNYTVPEVNLNLNGIISQGENIADNGGIMEAYHAYNKWVAKNGVEPRLPGLPYTPKQMFWISSANAWCSKYRLNALKIRIVNEEHPPGKYRINGPLSNMAEFSKDYNCASGTKMNPEKKCKCDIRRRMASYGKIETEKLIENLQHQLDRLVSQLEDIENSRDDMDQEEYDEAKEDTLEQLKEFNERLEKMVKGDVSLVSTLGAIQIATQAAISMAFRTPEVRRLFGRREPKLLREKLTYIEQECKYGKITTSTQNQQKIEILTALRQLGEQLTPDELQFLEQNRNDSPEFRNVEFIQVKEGDE